MLRRTHMFIMRQLRLEVWPLLRVHSWEISTSIWMIMLLSLFIEKSTGREIAGIWGWRLYLYIERYNEQFCMNSKPG